MIMEKNSYLKNAIAIKKWMKERRTAQLPFRYSKDEEERSLGLALKNIRNYLLKPYEKLETEEEKEEYKIKYPYFEEVKQIIDEIEKNKLNSDLKNAIAIKKWSPYLKNAIAIKKWMEERETTKPPSASVKDEEEKRLGRALMVIRHNLLKPYEKLETEEEKEEYKIKYPDFEEIKQIVDVIDRNNLSAYLKNARLIKKWMEERERTKQPSASAKDEEERRLGKALSTIRYKVLKPYEKLETEEKREEYKRRYSYFEEIKQIVDEIDSNRSKKLDKLIEEDIEKRRILKQAKELEANYKEQLTIKRESKDVIFFEE